VAEDRRLTKYEEQLAAIPAEFRKVAEWGWTELRPMIERHAREHGMQPIDAMRVAGRLARLVVSQLHGDIVRDRTTIRIRG